MNEKLKLWEDTGLLENMPIERKMELANRLDELAHYLISLEKDHDTNSFIFPSLCRIYREAMIPLGKFAFVVDISELVQEVRDSWDKHGIGEIPGVDVEAEFYAIFCENYINKLKKYR